jgi:trehalose/maltose hydrolase-like predicted phosphorylase
LPEPSGAVQRLRDATAAGFDSLLDEHRQAWAARWDDADIVLTGDDDLQEATRLALFHLMASVPGDGEAAVGARGLSGPGYRGHVFWDADTFTLPFLAATHPAFRAGDARVSHPTPSRSDRQRAEASTRRFALPVGIGAIGS